MEGGGGDPSDQRRARTHLLGIAGGYLERDGKGELAYAGKFAFIFSFFSPQGGQRHDANWSMMIPQIPWTFSIILESLAVLPQISLLRYTAIPTAITSYYLLALGVYRALYIPNWIVRYIDPKDHFFEPWAVIFGVLQTILYVEFAWIYWRRQRVKIRDNGAILDGEDFIAGGLILRWIGTIGGKSGERSTGGGWRGWGAGGGGGISVSADEEADLVGEEFGDSDEEDEDEGLESESGSEGGAVVR